MPDSIERLVRGVSVLRLLSLATLLLIALCIVISASIALADEQAPAATPAEVDTPAIEAIEPDRRMLDHSLAAVEDLYEFDFPIQVEIEPHPEFDELSTIQDI